MVIETSFSQQVAAELTKVITQKLFQHYSQYSRNTAPEEEFVGQDALIILSLLQEVVMLKPTCASTTKTYLANLI